MVQSLSAIREWPAKVTTWHPNCEEHGNERSPSRVHPQDGEVDRQIMSDIRFQSANEARWFVAYCRFVAMQREHPPSGSTYGYIDSNRKRQLRHDARALMNDMIDNHEKSPTEAAYRLSGD